jgi:CO/xanthine dehydrogenase FAD-binding subunit
MLSNIQRVVRPETVADAIECLRDGGDGARAMAGGTAQSLFRSREVHTVVDLWSVPLRGMRVDGGELVIGATTTMGDLARSEAVRGWAGGALWEAARAVASTPLRNLITAGGNLASLYPWANLPPALLALDARVGIAGGEAHDMAVGELVEHHPSKVLGHDALITEIRVPRWPDGTASAFLKHGLSRVDYTWLDVAATVELDGGRCRSCRLAVGGVEPRCRRLTEVEDLVEAATLDEEVARQAGELAACSVDPIHDPRFSKDYRRQLVATQCQRALLAARDRVGGGA